MFRFTIRDVLWLMVASATAVAWCADRGSLAQDNARLVLKYEEQVLLTAKRERALAGLRDELDDLRGRDGRGQAKPSRSGPTLPLGE
jgi:hypothetical protein